jgi:hypothetical protein
MSRFTARTSLEPRLGRRTRNLRAPNLAQPPNLPQELRSIQVLARFCLRMSILIIFAAFGSIGFGRSLAALLWMSTILSAVIGFMKREAPFDKVFNHWDETVAYAALCCLVSGYNQTMPI